MEQRCKICEKLKMFQGEGNNIKGNWYCCWNCTKEALYVGLITKQDIRNRDFDDEEKFNKFVEREARHSSQEVN